MSGCSLRTSILHVAHVETNELSRVASYDWSESVTQYLCWAEVRLRDVALSSSPSPTFCTYLEWNLPDRFTG